MNKSLIHTVIEQQCVLAPQAIALEQEGERLSYGQLNAASNQLAHLLLGLGIQPQQAVAVALPAGIQAVRSLLACLKAGALYLPLELGFAAQRLRQMLTDLQPSVLLVGAEQQAIAEALLAELACPVAYLLVLPSPQLDWLGDLSLSDRQLIDLSDQVRVLAYGPQGYQLSPQSTLSEPQHNPDLDLDPQGHNYVFYTSGSTGQGKAIVGTHRSLSHYIHWHMAQWGIDAQFRISQLAPLTFDASLKDILVALAAGATLCIPQVSTRQNMEQLANWLVSSRVTLLACVPSVFRLLQTALVGRAVPALPQLRYVLLSGERLYGRDVLNWQAVNGQHSELTNLYGLTETTILKTYYRLPHWDWQPGEVVPVGKPISNTSLAVVNGNHLSGREIVGEIYIKSPFLSAGYLDASLNAGMFIQNPLVSDRVDLVCRTGDMGRYRSDGNLEVLGRQDEQVKLHGIRVELGEVRGAVLSLEGIVQVELVVQQSAEGNGELVCYYQGTHRSGEQFREALAGLLNGYMIPAYYEWLEQFPLTLNGKVDRKALPLPVALESSYEAPQGALEEQLARIWQQVLGIPRVSRRESFFNLGGSSLKAIQLISRLYKELEIQLQIGEVFAHPTLAGQAELIGESLQQVYQAIEPVAASADYALSHGQKRLWIQEQLQPGLVAYSRPIAFEWKGELNQVALEHAFEEVVARHESLRTVFVVVEGEPRQRILSVEEAAFVPHYQDLRSQADPEQVAIKLADEQASAAFDLSQGPLLRVKLLQTDEQTYCLLLTIHHIISDEWSMQVLVREVLSLYGAYHEGLPSPLSALPIQYKDYAAWQQGQLSGAALLAHQQYWLEQLSGEVPLLELPTDRPRPALQTYRGHRLGWQLNQALSGELEALSQQQGVTLFMVLLAGLNTLLYRYSGQSDLIVGSPIAGRQHADLEEQIGFFINMLPLRTQVDGQGSFVDLLKGVKQTTLGAYAHQAYPFDRLVEDLQLVRDPSRSPLFDVVLVVDGSVDPATHPVLGLEEVEIAPAAVAITSSLFDLVVRFSQQGPGLSLSIEYNTDLFEQSSIERMGVHLESLLSALVAEPLLPLQQVGYLSESERHQLLVDFNATTTEWDSEQTLVSLFEHQVSLTPQAVALVSEQDSVSYEELNQRANQLAHYLRGEHGVEAGTLVGIQLERSEWLVVAMLSVLKAGGAYVPIDPDYPAARQAYLRTDSGCEVVLEAAELAIFQAGQYASTNLDVGPQPSDLAYVIYTSGSTGQPKGVMIEHRSVVNYVIWANQYYFHNQPLNFGMFTSYSFDLTVTGLFSPLLRGSSLYLWKGEDHRQLLGQALKHPKVGAIKLTPAHLNLLPYIQELTMTGVECCIVGGEILTESQVKAIKQLNEQIRIFNEYGPTEATVGCTAVQLQAGQAITIGKPISNSQVYILDGGLGLQPIGVVGELCISGAGLARGYLNQSVLTAEKFVTNPYYQEDQPASSARLYRTGDQARWREDGTIEFLGRQDEQVKLRGYRIELGEIEAVLSSHPQLSQAVVMACQLGEDDKQLVAYLVGSDPEVSGESLRAYLTERLPAYMIPSQFVLLEALPLTVNGKVDKKALPDPVVGAGAEHQAPQTALQQQLASLWEQVLGREGIGLEDNFFALGGHSLKAIQLGAKIHQTLDVKLELVSLFKHQTLLDLSQQVELMVWAQTAHAEQELPHSLTNQPHIDQLLL